MPQDRTYQTVGAMLVGVKNDTNWGMMHMPANFDSTPRRLSIEIDSRSLSYLPRDKPPRAWTPGVEYDFPSAHNNNQIPVYRATTVSSYQDNPFQSTSYYSGPQWFLAIMDRSKNTVEEDKTYTFTATLHSGFNMGIRFTVNIKGVSGGSTVEPGIGLLNTKQNPGAWYNHSPVGEFTGNWSFNVQHPNFDTLLTIGADYVEPFYGQQFKGETLYSRLIFTLSGGLGQSKWYAADPNYHDLVNKCGQRIVA